MIGLFLRGALCAAVMTTPLLAQFQVRSSANLPGAQALGELMDVGEFTMQRLDVPAELGLHTSIGVEIDGQPMTMVVYPSSVRSANFRLIVQGADGEYTDVEAPESRTYTGTLLEVPGSVVSGSIFEGELDMVVSLGENLPLWGIEPHSRYSVFAEPGDHIVYNQASIIDRGYECGTDTAEVEQLTDSVEPGGSFSGLGFLEVCEIACDGDFEWFNFYGSVAAAEARIETIIGRVQDIYEADVSIQYEITAIIIRTAEPDPYGSSSAGTLLNQFRNHWNANQGAIQRDVAHLFTGKNLNGSTIGIASLNVICSVNSAYGLSQRIGNTTSQTGLVAHELGHNWNSPHCNGTADCKIMCASLGGCGSITSFGPFAIGRILGKKNQVNCLTPGVLPPPPVLTSSSPTQVSALGAQSGEFVTLNGVDMDSVLEVQWGEETLLPGSGFTVISPTEVLVTDYPLAVTLDPVTVTVSNFGGPSNSLNVGVAEHTPPFYSAPFFISSAVGNTVEHLYATTNAQTCFWIFSTSGATGTYQGFTLLATPLLIAPVPTGPAGTAIIPLETDPTLSGLTYYTQMAFFEGSLQTISSVKQTNIF